MANKKKIVLWGEGKWTENAVFEIKRMALESGQQIEIEYYISDKDLLFIDKQRYTYETAPNINQKYIVIACHDKKYLEIKKELISNGKEEFKDFIGYRMFGKKICIINMNCYGFYIKPFLEQNSKFREIYGIYPIPAIHENKELMIDENVLKNTELYIHQDIRENNYISEKLSDKYIFPKLKKGCVKICVPNFVGLFNGFYPNIQNKTYTNVDNETMFFKDTVIEEAYSVCGDTGKLDKIMEYIYNYKFDSGLVKEQFNHMICRLRQREKNWDIKIVDYIIDNYKRINLIEDINHPTVSLLYEICNRLLELLEIENTNYEKTYNMGFAMEIFVMPQVKQILGMEWKKERVRLYTIDYCFHDRQPINYRQFVQEYIWKVFNVMLV